MKLSEVKALHYLTHQKNAASILQIGILAHNQIRANDVAHETVYNDEIVERRQKILPNGRSLLDYANLYFNCRNAMMYKLVQSPSPSHLDLCVFRVQRRILSESHVLASDMNAARSGARIQPSERILPLLNAEEVYSEYWTKGTPRENYIRKGRMMAEVLVPGHVPVEFVGDIIVSGYPAQEQLRELLGESQVAIRVKNYDFFQWTRGPRGYRDVIARCK